MASESLPTDLPTLPNDWGWRTLDTFLTEGRTLCYGIVQPGEAVKDGVPVLRVGDLSPTVSIRAAKRVSREIELAYERSRLQGGEILLSLVGTLGLVAIAPNEAAGCNIARAIGMIPVPRNEARFLELCLRSELVQKYMYRWATTTVQATLNLRDVRRLPIPVPPSKERERIAAVLGALDDKIELNRKMNQTLEEIAQAIFKSWFIDFDGVPEEDLVDSELGAIPRGWTTTEMDDEITLNKGLSYQSKHFDELGVPMVNLKCIARDGGFQRRGLKYYGGGFKPHHILEPGDIVVAMTDLTQDRVVIASPAFVPPMTSATTIIMSLDLSCPRPKPNSYLKKEWLYYRFHTREFKEFARSFANGTTVLHLKLDGIKRFRFVKPPQGLVDRFSRMVAIFQARINNNSDESDTLVELRDTLLPKLISGELRVPAAEEIVGEHL